MEEVNKKNKTKNTKERGTDFALKILSLIIAVIVWFVLSITQYPTITKTITKVPVTFSLDGTVAGSKGLSPINYQEIQVDVEIKGMNYEIGNYTNNDLVATVNLDKVTSEGTHQLDIEVKSSHSTDKCTIVSVSPQTVTVDFDRIAEKTLTVEAEAPLIRAEEGFTLRDTGTAVNPSEVTVRGAKNDIDNIDKAVAKISKSKIISEDTVISADDIIFYDADDNVIDDSKIEIQGDKKFDVSFRIYKKKTANLKLSITGCPDNFNVESLPLIMSESQISVISPNLKDKDTETVEIGSMELSDINLKNTNTYDIKLGEGEINLNGTEKVRVSFNSDGYASKVFTLAKSHIKLKNKPLGITARIETAKLSNVIIYGPESVLSKLSADDIYASVDLNDIADNGSYTRNALVYVPKYDNVWSYGTNEVQIKAAK